ncbi:efflux RND transporter periplasmic adaptor subunit [Sulfuricurvum sp.]|uniref:efflux RND transporter periplasmic adaptor subunit n=1 Tax=Sulfuricurvum sp. TaxID=2025608 RepID=UPI003564360C
MRFPLTLSCTLALLLLTGCDKAPPSGSEKVAATHAPDITLVSPEFGTFNTEISTTASVQPSPDGIVSITAPVDGTINKIHIAVGDKISSGSPLITIRSSDISDVQSDQLSAKAAYTQAKHIYTMNKELFKLGAITANDLALSQSNLTQAEAMVKGFSQKLNYFDAASDQTLTLHSPINGVVYEIATHLGEKISNDTTQALVKIANPHKKVVVATVYEKDLSAFFVGKQVDIKLENSETGPIKGKVTYISDVLDPDNKTIKVYIQPSIDSSELRINTFANIYSGTEKKDVFRIPKKSLLYKEGKFIVFVKKDNQFTPLNVTLVSDDPKDSFSLVKGLPENTQIALEAIALEKE